MRRSAYHCSPVMENLELRQVMSSGGPTAEAQFMLELLNEARTNPSAAAERATTNLDPEVKATLKYYNVDLNQVKQEIASTPAKPPLAWSDELSQAADWQSRDQINYNYQGHERPDGTGPGLNDRLNDAGYRKGLSTGENAYAYGKSVDVAMKAFLIDWGVESRGHFRNILQPDVSAEQAYREVGLGIVNVDPNASDLGPKVITQDFGRKAGDKAILVGVVYSDQNQDRFYSVGEGRGDVSIDVIDDATGKAVTSLSSWDAGGFQAHLDAGTYRLVARQGDKTWTQKVSINSLNAKIDFDLSKPADVSPAKVSKVETVPVPVIVSVAPPTSTPSTSTTSSTAPALNSTITASTPSASNPLPGTGSVSWPYSWYSWSPSRSSKR